MGMKDTAQVSQVMSTGLASSESLMQLQQQADSAVNASVKRSQVSGLTFEIAVSDARDALMGITTDLAGNTSRRSLVDIVTYKDRLRGLGVIMIALAVSGVVVDYIMAM